MKPAWLVHADDECLFFYFLQPDLGMDSSTGEIKALIGGVQFGQSQWNRALQARRQMGSIFKPLVYAVAVEQGKNFAEVSVDEPFQLQIGPDLWAPVNANGEFEGAMTLARALSVSNNIITIKTLLEVGCDKVKDLAVKFHLPPVQPLPSLALGCVDVTLKEAVGCFNVFANNGTYVEPHYVVWVKDALGNKIYKHRRVQDRALHPRVSGQVAQVLGIGMERLHAKLESKWVDSDAIGKTGTTNDFRTSWFVGSTPEVTTGIYIGRDDNQPMGEQMFARRTAFPIWYALHKGIKTKKKKFTYDASLTPYSMHERTGQPVEASDPEQCVIMV